jgi:uncharacterized protein (DUF2147 family)
MMRQTLVLLKPSPYQKTHYCIFEYRQTTRLLLCVKEMLIMKSLFWRLLILVLSLCPALVFSSDLFSPAGRWKTIDDETGKPKSIMVVVMRGDTLVATIDSLFRGPDETPDPVCDLCTGWRKNKKVRGLTITDVMVKHGNEWNGGWITDPKNGKTYKCIIKIKDNGEKIEVRGYIGLSLIGRSQYWYRIK